MCIVSVAWQAHPDWQLIVLGNRDELHARPAKAVARWKDASDVIAGRDEQAGGTWLGISEKGRFAVVTNVAGHQPPDPDNASRGYLLRKFLSIDRPIPSISNFDLNIFNPFNLFTVSNGEAKIHTNRPQVSTQIVKSGIYGLSNGSLEDPWPKSKFLNDKLENWLSSEAINPRSLLDYLTDEQIFSVESNDTAEATIKREHLQSPLFIRNPIYGTRCSSLVAVNRKGEGLFLERRFLPSGETNGESEIRFRWPSK